MKTKTKPAGKKSTKVPVPTMTDITVLLDRSGSMASVKTDTIGGFNTFLKEQQKAKGDARLTLAQFDMEYEIVHEGKPVKDVPPLNDSTFVPRGSTALLDAMGRTIVSAKARVKPGELVVFVVLTDGQENSSHEYTKAAIRAMVEEHTKAGWQFVYLGANHDSFFEAGAIGFQQSKVANYAGSPQKAMLVASSNVNLYRSSGNTYCTDFSAGQRANLVDDNA